MTEKQLFYPLLSVYFSLILGDLQKEKLQIVSIFRFGHKKRGLFQCPPTVGSTNIVALKMPESITMWPMVASIYRLVSMPQSMPM